ncbi:MAG: ethylbenzene dehydrogenase-related protein [Haloarculaceae archaeon]
MAPLTRRRRRAALVLALLAVGALAPALTTARPLNEVPVTRVSADRVEQYGRPTSDAWDEAVPVEVPLSSAPSSVPDADDTSVDRVTVRTARTEETLFVRLSWADATADGNVSGSSPTPSVDSFGDAAAVQVPVNTTARPGIAMGSSRQMVNVWYWNAYSGEEELLAGGPGTVTAFEDPTVETAAAYEDGRWHVVFTRELRSARSQRTSFDMRNDVSVAFAVWNGSNMERSGRKSVSEWHHFPFAPEEGTALYEALLWGVAGLAIVVVVVVTVTAVRRGE